MNIKDEENIKIPKLALIDAVVSGLFGVSRPRHPKSLSAMMRRPSSRSTRRG
jgi:hypothetical protein